MRRRRPDLAALPTFAGGPWYEEDGDAALIVTAFPEYFEASAREYAAAMLPKSLEWARQRAGRCYVREVRP